MSYTIKGKHEVKTAFQMQRRIHHRDLQVSKCPSSCTPIVKRLLLLFALNWPAMSAYKEYISLSHTNWPMSNTSIHSIFRLLDWPEDCMDNDPPARW